MTIPSPTGTWSDILRGSNFDPNNDQQSNSSSDLVGNASNAMLQGMVADASSDPILYLRARMGDADASTSLYLGIDLNGDGHIDVFVEANNHTTKPFVSFHTSDPSKAGTGPSDTGWLSSQTNALQETRLASGKFYLDNSASAGTNLDGNTSTDSWLQFGFKLSDLQSFVQAALGYNGLTLNSALTIYAFTSTSNTANGDIGGVDDSVASNLTKSWLDLGIGQTGSLSSLLTGVPSTPTVDHLATTDTSPLITGTWGGDHGGTDTLSVTIDGVTYTTSSATPLVIDGTHWSLQLPTLVPETLPKTYDVTASVTRDSTTINDASSGELVIGNPADTTAPTLSSSGPADNATGVSPTAPITLTFSEAVYPDSGTITLVDAAGNAETFSLATGRSDKGGSVSFDGSTVTLTPGNALTRSTDYHVLVSNTAVTDASGNAYAGISSSTTLNFTTGAGGGTPAAPVITPLLTNDASPTLTGTWGGTQGGTDTLTVIVDGQIYTIGNGITLIDATHWSISLPALTDGTYDVSAHVDRAGGGTSSDSTTNELTIDSTAPTTTVTIVKGYDNVGPMQGDLANGDSTNDTTPTLSGTLSNTLATGETLAIYQDGVFLGNASVSGTTWTFTGAALTDGTTSHYTAAVLDAAQNKGPVSNTFDLTIDTTAPTTTVTIVKGYDDVDPKSGDLASGDFTNDTTPTLSGTLSNALATGETLAIYKDGVYLGNASVSGTTWSYTGAALTDGTTAHYTAAVLDAAQNKGPVSNTFNLTIDTTAPTTTVTIVKGYDDVDPKSGDLASGDSTNDTTPTLSGTLSHSLATGETLAIYQDGVYLGTASVSGTNWTFTGAALSDGTTAHYTAAVLDAAQNKGAVSNTFNLTIDTTAPTTTATIVKGFDNFGPMQGDLASGDSTNDTTPTLSGTLSNNLASGETLAIYRDGVYLGTASVSGTTWSFTSPALSNGTAAHFTAAVLDGAQNKGPVSNTFDLNIDTTAPITTARAKVTWPIMVRRMT